MEHSDEMKNVLQLVLGQEVHTVILIVRFCLRDAKHDSREDIFDLKLQQILFVHLCSTSDVFFIHS